MDTSIAFWASRYGKSTDGTDDYLNCPFDRPQYERFVDELLAAQAVAAHIPEDDTPYFEACLPIEELARRGRDTLRFGPMKPMGLTDPRTGRRPWAVVQLRQENLRAQSFNLVGFQNHLKFGDQARILRMIPGLEKAEFLRFGQIHRNTYINAPALLTPTLQLRARPADLLRRPDFRRGRLRGSHRHRPDGGHARRRAGRRKRAAAAGARDGAGIAVPLHLGRRPGRLSAGQHHLRPAAAARRADPPQTAARQAGAPRRGLPPRAGGAGGMGGRAHMSELAAQIDRYLQELVRGGNSSHTVEAYARRSAPVSRLPLAARDRTARARAPSTC